MVVSHNIRKAHHQGIDLFSTNTGIPPMQIRGIIPPVATPMQANEDLDLPRLKWFLDHLITSGVHGVFVLGTNSECYAMDDREKQEVIATAVEHVHGRVPVY